jgi:predicted transcriptional regulator
MEGQRVELNAMTSDQFVAFVEDKLTEAGIAKVVPLKDQLAEAYRLFARSNLIEEAVEKFIKEMPAGTIAVPDDLNARVRDYLDENPESPWEEAVRHAVERASEEKKRPA